MSYIIMEKKPPRFKTEEARSLFRIYKSFWKQLDKLYGKTSKLQDDIEDLIEYYEDTMDRIQQLDDYESYHSKK